jgi:WS/DGAT/MGAT family acyltransferase
MRLLSPLDAVFLRMESKRTPMHIGAMMTFVPPADAGPNFVRELLADFAKLSFLPSPFDCRLVDGPRRLFAPAWVEAEPDPEYHVRHSALPAPGGQRELGTLVARLHSNQLDFDRPLWEAHLVEGLEGGRFAFYFKAHHCAIDGIGAVRVVKKWLTKDPDDRRGLPDLSGQHRPRRASRSLADRVQGIAGTVRDHSVAVPELAGKLARMGVGANSTIRAAMETPRTIFNVPITQQRRLAAAVVDLERLRAVGKAAEATVNDVTLAVLGAALRRYLLEQDALPKSSVMASVPVALARSGSSANAVAGFVAPLGTAEADPRKRLELINAATGRAKREISSLSRNASTQFSLLGLAPLAIGQMTGTLPKLPPFFNFTVSNVPLSREPLYLKGARLEAVYPMSFLADGYALNVTLVGYADHVNFGFLGCRDAVPHLQRLGVYTSEALDELADAVGA